MIVLICVIIENISLFMQNNFIEGPMRYTITWDNHERTILHGHLEPGWDWDTFFGVMADCYMMIRTVRHPVDIVLTGMDESQPSGSILQHLHSLRGSKPPNVGRLVLVRPGKIMQAIHSFYNLISQTQLPMLLADSLDEARALLADYQIRA